MGGVTSQYVEIQNCASEELATYLNFDLRGLSKWQLTSFLLVRYQKYSLFQYSILKAKVMYPAVLHKQNPMMLVRHVHGILISKKGKVPKGDVYCSIKMVLHLVTLEHSSIANYLGTTLWT